MTDSKLRRALVLSGSGGRGAYHVRRRLEGEGWLHPRINLGQVCAGV